MEFQVLGALDVVDADGTSVAPRAARQRRLLAGLLLDAGRHVSADRLVEVVWDGDERPKDPLRSLRTYVSRLRGALSEVGAGSLLLAEPMGYRLAVAEESVDAQRFVRAVSDVQELLRAGRAEDARSVGERALSWWRGAAYAEFADLPAFQPEVVRLEELRLVLTELWIEALLTVARPAEAVAEAERLVRVQPLRQGPRRQLMLALRAAGRQGDALATFREYHRLLAEEMGLDPSAELTELHARIARGDGFSSTAPEVTRPDGGTRRREPRDRRTFPVLALVGSLVVVLTAVTGWVVVSGGDDGRNRTAYYTTDGTMPAASPDCFGVLGICLGDPIDTAATTLGSENEVFYEPGYRSWKFGELFGINVFEANGRVIDIGLLFDVQPGNPARAATPHELVLGSTTLDDVIDALGSDPFAFHVVPGERLTEIFWEWQERGPDNVEYTYGVLLDTSADTRATSFTGDEAMSDVIAAFRDDPVNLFTVRFAQPGGDL